MTSAQPGTHKWMVLSNTTLGVLASAVNSSIILISLPAIFRGIGLHPLDPGNTNTLLWTIMGYMVVTSVLVVTFGRLGDMFGRARIYNIGFVIFTIAALFLSFMPTGSNAAAYLVWMRILQGVGGAMITATSTAILVDAFPPHERGFALGINTMAAIAGQFIGLILGGVLADINWRWIFWINVPIGVVGATWGLMMLRDRVAPKGRSKHDWWGNITFAIGLVLVLVGVNDGIQPHGASLMAWGSPKVLAELGFGLIFLVAFVAIEKRVALPMFDLKLFRIRPFTAGVSASMLSSIGRGGLQFMLIVWLQGIWLPLHGYSFESTPLWAGIFMLPLTLGILLAGPVAGLLADRFGSRLFATLGMLLGAVTFLGMMLLDADFPYPIFAALLFLNGVGTGLFSAPNSTQIMNAVPASERGQASGVRATTLNAGQVLSIGIFFTLMIIGLAMSLPGTMEVRLVAEGLPQDVAAQVASAPPVASLFAAFLGYNPMGELIPAAALSALSPDHAAVITGQKFFPDLLSGPFMVGIKIAFSISMLLYLLSALASWLGGSTRKQEAIEEAALEAAE
ncbi:MFS transporter [Youhaiella tibetensis]|uniref:MFS transporter n=1 Tax=Paradevosia tibetensis TaxID=1447062 RepID=A0A5B9DL62_9HYPH|nr:MFS transporter [Youhaiella tibetensis]QEE19897.1 MFS transporter [Youhaiella tibetensis]